MNGPHSIVISFQISIADILLKILKLLGTDSGTVGICAQVNKPELTFEQMVVSVSQQRNCHY
jgi:hypothetical protein